MKQLNVSVGIVVNLDGEILLAERTVSSQETRWEFPGGKIEPGETADAALIRELKEEVGIDVTSYRKMDDFSFSYPDRHVSLSVWWVDAFDGIAYGREGQMILWAQPEALSALPLLEANDVIVERIQQHFLV